MIAVNTPKRLLCMIVLTLFIPWLSVALTSGWTSRQFLYTLCLTMLTNIALGAFEVWKQYPNEPTQISPFSIIVGNLTTLAGIVYAIHTLIKLHYNPDYLPAYEESQTRDTAIDIGEAPAPRNSKV